MAQFDIADIAGSIERGEQFRQAGQLRPLQLAQQEQLLKRGDQQFRQGEQNLQFGAAKEQTRTDAEKNLSLVNTALRIQNARDEDFIPLLEANIQRVQGLGGDASISIAALERARAGDFEGVRKDAGGIVKAGVQQGIINAPPAPSKPVSKQQATGGLVFDPTTGKYSVDEVARKRFDVLAKKKETGNLGIKEKQSINKDISGFIKNAVDIKTTANDLVRLKDLGTGASSIAAIFKFMKANDPTSTVREGEFATAENSGGVPAAIWNFYNKTMTGERIEDKEVAQFVSVAKTLANSAIESSSGVVGDYLNTFGSDLGGKFPVAIMKRIPDPFDEAPKGDTEAAKILPEGVSEDDISTTMQIHGMTREAVLARLGGK